MVIKVIMRKKESITRDKIIKNALKIFAQKGFYKTTVDDIAGATGVAKGTVYLYFKDKQDLYIATMDEHFSSALHMLTEVEKTPGTPSEKMHHITNDFVNYIIHLRTNYMPFTFENLTLTGKTLKKINTTAQPKVSAMIEIISRIIKQGIENNEFRKVDPRLAAFHFLSTIRAILFSSSYLANDAIKKESILELFFEGLNKRR
jgi:AcrR family transcriptional regulator